MYPIFDRFSWWALQRPISVSYTVTVTEDQQRTLQGRVLLDKLTVRQQANKFTAYNRTRRPITIFTWFMFSPLSHFQFHCMFNITLLAAFIFPNLSPWSTYREVPYLKNAYYVWSHSNYPCFHRPNNILWYSVNFLLHQTSFSPSASLWSERSCRENK